MNRQQEEAINRLKNKGYAIGRIAVAGAMKQVADEGTLMLGVTVGLMQGLKYNGDFKRGVKAGVTTVAVVAGVNGIRNVANQWEFIRGF